MPFCNGWTKDKAGNMTFQWKDDYILPPELLNILAAIPNVEGNQNTDDSDIDSDNDDDV